MKTTKLFWLVSAIALTKGSEELFLEDSIELVTAPSAASHNSTQTASNNTSAASNKTSSSNTTTAAPSASAFSKTKINLWTTEHIIGTILMMILITLSNAGGLSGAGSNIPIMLIFFNMGMAEAVPISAFVAVCATTFRFILNFN